MLLAAHWTRRERISISVATVDHGLRPEARGEAEQVGAWAKALVFPHCLLTWRGVKPRTRVQERARNARYALLAECARAASNHCAIVTAHHADDQAETILMRLTRGSGVAGLAGMAAASTVNGVRLLRPLLDTPKQALESYCVRSSHPYFHDPSNAEEKFARVRLRSLASTLEREGLTKAALLRLGHRAARAEEALSRAVADAAERAVVAEKQNEVRLDARAVAALPIEILQRLLAREIVFLFGTAQLRLERLERAADVIAKRLETGERLRLTLGGALASLEGDALVLRPAPVRRRGSGS
jgi:tRNA(Ile)-lysidine synthase